MPTALTVELRRRRQYLELRQKDLAPRIGVNRSTLARWERRTADPGLAGLSAWAEELGFNVVLVSASDIRAD